MLSHGKSQRLSGAGRLYFRKPNAEGGTWHSEGEERRGSRTQSQTLRCLGNVRSGIQADTAQGEGVSLPLFSQEQSWGSWVQLPRARNSTTSIHLHKPEGGIWPTPAFQSARSPFTMLSFIQLQIPWPLIYLFQVFPQMSSSHTSIPFSLRPLLPAPHLVALFYFGFQDK